VNLFILPLPRGPAKRADCGWGDW